MTTIKLSGPVDLERLHDVCAGITAPVSIGASDDKLTLSLSGTDATGCKVLLAEWLELAGIEVAQPGG